MRRKRKKTKSKAIGKVKPGCIGCNFSGLASGGGAKAGEVQGNAWESFAKLPNTSPQLIPPFVSHAEPLLLQNATFSQASTFPGNIETGREGGEGVGVLQETFSVIS